MNRCDVCAREARCRKCSRCGVAFYCDTACQRAAWPKHKGLCANGVSALLFPSGDPGPITIHGPLTFSRCNRSDRETVLLLDGGDDGNCVYMDKETYSVEAPENARAGNLLRAFLGDECPVAGPVVVYQEDAAGYAADLTFARLAEISRGAADDATATAVVGGPGQLPHLLSAAASYLEGIGRLNTTKEKLQASDCPDAETVREAMTEVMAAVTASVQGMGVPDSAEE